MADDALDVNAMNVKPGGKQRIMRDTIWNGKSWHMYITAQDGTKVAKGMKMLLGCQQQEEELTGCVKC